MIVTWRITLRIAVIVLLAAILQVSFFSYLSIFGAVPDLVGVVVVSLGLLGGGVIGAVCGFALGLVMDSVLLQTLGVSSIVLLTMGYLAGRYREGFEISSALAPPLLAAGLTVLGASIFAAIQLMLGVETPVSLLVVREVLVKGLLAFLLTVPLYPLMRRVLRPALVDDASGRRATSPVRSRLRRRRRGTGGRRGGSGRVTGAVPPRRVRGGVA
ncbi:MAG: rod shape-determining protein MreD [Solirubrobacterales bacterium]